VSHDIVLVSSCTSSKLRAAPPMARSAETLYTGQQHIRLMRGVTAYRTAGQPAGHLRFRILSALHGLLASNRSIKPYDHSFSGLPAPAIRREAHEKNIPADVRGLLRKPYALGLLLLADPYLRACDLTPQTTLGGPLIVFCSPAAAARLPKISGLRGITLSNAEARRFSCGMIALKGELGRRILSRLAERPGEIEDLVDPCLDVLKWLQNDVPAYQLELTAA
jgi:hypothetical protein